MTLWLPAPLGQAAAIEAMGTIAAPLLGGFAFAAIGLVIEARPKVRWPDQTLGPRGLWTLGRNRRWSYNLAIVLLFAATAVFLVPRSHDVGGWRTAGIAIAGLAALGECLWVAIEEIGPVRRRQRIRLDDDDAEPGAIRTPRIKPPER